MISRVRNRFVKVGDKALIGSFLPDSILEVYDSRKKEVGIITGLSNRARISFGVVENQVLISSSLGQSSTIEVYDAEMNSIHTISNLQHSSREFASIGKKTLLINGNGSSILEIYDSISREVTTIPNLPSRSRHGSLVINGQVLFGFSMDFKFDVYDTVTGEVTFLETMSRAFGDHSVLMGGTQAVFLQHHSDNNANDFFEIYDSISKTVTKIPASNATRLRNRALVLSTNLYMLTSNPHGRLEIYNGLTKELTYVTIPWPVARTAITGLNNIFLLARSGNDTVLDLYDMNTGQWSMITGLMNTSYTFSPVINGQVLIVTTVGGINSSIIFVYDFNTGELTRISGLPQRIRSEYKIVNNQLIITTANDSDTILEIYDSITKSVKVIQNMLPRNRSNLILFEDHILLSGHTDSRTSFTDSLDIYMMPALNIYYKSKESEALILRLSK